MTPNTTTNRYGDIAAEIYDIDKQVGGFPDTAFHLENLADVRGPILEPACGSGRTLLPLLRAGHDAVGFDLSIEMLDRCRARCAEHGFSPDVTRQTFADFAYETRFAAIVVPAGSFTLIDDYSQALAVLRRFHDHLAPGGMIILDIQSLWFLGALGDDQRQWTAENGDLLTLHGRRVATDWLRQRSEALLRYERWRDNRLVESQLEPMAQRYWGLEEFRLTLAAAGYSDITVTGGYQRRAPTARDRTMTFAARRPS